MTKRVSLGEDISRLVSREDGEQLEMLTSDVAVDLNVLGLKSLAQLLLSRVSLRVLMTLLSLSEDPLLVSLLFFFNLMI